MLNEIADLILSYTTKIVFLPEEERRIIRLELYKCAESLYKSNPSLFNSASLALLDNYVPLLETDSYQAKMECAQIWHKNGFDVWVFRIRYYLNLSPESDSVLLQKKIKDAFSCKNSNFINNRDARTGYDRLFYQIFRSDAPEDYNLRSTLSNLLTIDIANDIDGVITYVMVNDQLPKRMNIPSYLKNIYIVVTNISVIQGDGLYGWLIENKITTLRNLYVALRKMGLLNISQIASELYEFVNKNQSSLRPKSEDNNVIDQIELFERRLLDSLKNEDIISFAEKYLALHKTL